MNHRNAIPFSSSALAVATTSILAACLWFGAGCTSDSTSGSDFVRNVDIDYTGVYTATGDNLVSQNSGDSIDTLNLSQSGANLEAFDNNGLIWRGDLSRIGEESSSFRLDGQTTAGRSAQIVGNLTGTGTTGSMTGTYIESDLFGIVSATATISQVQTNTAVADDGGDELAISPTGQQTLTSGQTRQFTASGGDGTFTWTISNTGIGSLSNSTGQTVTYTAVRAGTQSITVRSDDDQQSTSISQTGF